ncbi:hypothetical protein [Parasedimentitalea psychrophila]|uniref:Uncharacterized protein n=1 Tax=Parasedimentitalea psychrophila TaxID=2997337 RepID=A0A9Y2KVY2_9RHOB|nr:hypothetical protein [Parasedimentitalea psychrophila]WIY23668.1 hypothetical protein QPJ95_13520 [Parasedimentitalea psychrophila]
MPPQQHLHHLYDAVTGEYRGAVFATPEQLADMSNVAERDSPPLPDLQTLKDSALAVVRGIALEVRREIAASASPECSLIWVLKAVCGAVWQLNDAAANPRLDGVSAIAQAGFKLETDITGEAPVAVRDSSLEKAGLFFNAHQIVEGMERLAEDRIPTATTLAEQDTVTTQLRAWQTQARSTIETLSS